MYERYVQKVYQKCLTMTGDTEAAYDQTQDIFIKVLGRLSSFQQRSSFSTWLYSITYNHCLDTIRLQKRQNTESLQTYHLDQTESKPSETEADLLQLQLTLLQQLPEPELLLLKLHHEQGQSIHELSQALGIADSAVKMRLKRSRDRLKKQYNQRRCSLL